MKRLSILAGAVLMVVGFTLSAYGALVDMNDGTIYDTDTQLSWLKDAGAGGWKNWADSVAWAASLSVAGLTGWRLPTTDPTCGGAYNCTNSELGHLFYTELGNAAGGPLTNTGPFTNLQSNFYWSGTESASDHASAWYFYFSRGYQLTALKATGLYAWAVCPGARTLPSSTPVGYNPQWLIITLVSLTLVGSFLLRRRASRM